MSDHHDRIYAEQREIIERFSFDEKVVRVFPDMIRRSVPGYSTIVEMTGVLAARYAQPDTTLYDLGCSLGASSLAMASLVNVAGCRVQAVDNSEAMIASARTLIDANRTLVPVELRHADICEIDFQPASVFVLNFTLQFVPPARRSELIGRLASALRPGGVLVLSEKIDFDDPEESALQSSLHHAFKRNNGYSDLEISQKRTALEEVLVPETLATHRQRLLDAGFVSVNVWFRCFNFASMVAIR